MNIVPVKNDNVIYVLIGTPTKDPNVRFVSNENISPKKQSLESLFSGRVSTVLPVFPPYETDRIIIKFLENSKSEKIYT